MRLRNSKTPLYALSLAGLWLCCLSPLSSAQTTYEMAFRNLALPDGLSQNTVMDVLQDQYGYMWFATENGLDRYDGYELRSYRRGNGGAGELVNDYIWQVAEDNEGNLWLATNGGGVAFYSRDLNSFSHYRHDPENPRSLPSDRTRALLLTDAGLWVATLDAGLALLDPVSGDVTRFHHRADDALSLPSDEVFALLQDDSGRLWVGTEEGLAVHDPVTGRFKRVQHVPKNPYSLSSNRVRTLFQDRHGALWVGTSGGGLSMLDPRFDRFTHYQFNDQSSETLSDNHVRAITEDAEGRLWVGTAKGLNVLIPGTQSFRRYFGGREVGDLSDSYVMSLHQDRGGVLWVGTRTGGVNAWDSGSWNFGHSRPDWLINHSITSFASNGDGYWVGTFGGGLHYVDERAQETRTMTTTSETLALADDRVMALLTDSRGGLWIGTMAGGVHWLKDGDERFRVLTHDPADPNSLSADGAMSLFEDSRGSIWFGTFGGGVTRFEPGDNRFTRFMPDENDGTTLCGKQGRAFAEDSFGAIWIGTENGLCRYDPRADMFHSFRHDAADPESLADNSVYALLADSAGRLWVGTGGGGLSELKGSLNQPDSISFKTYSRDDGLSSSIVYAVLPGSDNMLWLSGNNGLMRFDPRSGAFTNYGASQGLQGEEFHFGAAHGSADGRLFFGGANGANIFDPRRLSSKAPAPQLVWSGISIMNQPLDAKRSLSALRELELGYRENALTLEFAALDYSAPEQNQYAYKLEGFDDDWIQAGSRRVATYTNLPGGHYVFRVRGSGSTGVWNENALDLDIRVGLAPWNTPWAYLAYAMFAVTVFALYAGAQRRKLKRESEYSARLREEVKARTQELEHNNLELQRLSQAKGEFLARMSHEIRSPMNGVLGMAELMMQTSLGAAQKKYTATILSSADSLLQIINDILDFSKLESGKLQLDRVDADLEQLVDETLAMFSLEAQKKGLQLVSLLPAQGLPRLKLDTLRLRQVMVNLLGNAIKFTDEGSVTLAVELEADERDRLHLHFRVSDTGIGIAKENQERIFGSFDQEDSSTSRRYGGTGLGLTISKDLVELMGGELMLESEVGDGATFSFELPLEKTTSGGRAERLPAMQSSAIVVCAAAAQRLQIEGYLENWGVRTRTCSAGLAALDALTDVGGQAPELIVVGSQLTDMSGLELVKGLCETGRAGTARMVLLSDIAAIGQQQTAPGVYELGEPLTRRELRKALSSTLAEPIVKPQAKPMRVAQLSDQTVEAADHPADHPADNPAQASARVLLVEDNVVNQEVMSAMLSLLGCAVDFAPDGRTGVQRARDGSYDAILMDYRLPDIDGVEATQRIRASEEGGNRRPIIAFTANAANDDRERCLAAGMDDFLAKPCTIAALSETLGRWMALPDASETEGEVRKKDALQSDARQNDAGAEKSTAVSRFDEKKLMEISALRRADGSLMLSHAVDVFLRTSEESVEAIARAVRNQDAAALRHVAHRLKSGCDNLGAKNMATLCRKLEAMGERGDLDAADTLLSQLTEEHKLAVVWLEEQSRELA